MENSLNPFLSFAICTYNRAFIITECLRSIIAHDGGEFDFEVLIVDNNSTDDTKMVVQPFIEENDNFRYVIEKEQGLSHARNRATNEANGAWIVYLDDDAILGENYFGELEKLLTNYDFDCFGGPFFPWYLYGKPPWFLDEWASSGIRRNDVGIIDGIGGWLTGGNFIIKKSILKTQNGFETDLGMTGNKIGFGEEDYLQIQLSKNGYRIGYSPNLYIYHAVLPHKFSLKWHLRASFMHGVSYQKNEEKTKLQLIVAILKSTIGLLVKRLPMNLYKVLISRNYYWQNLIFDTLHPILFNSGRFYKNIIKVIQ